MKLFNIEIEEIDIGKLAYNNNIKKDDIEKIEVPSYITENLKYKLFEWQEEALKRFLQYREICNKQALSSNHLMFNMATGTGKTLVMAALILYFYKQGYKHFLFFVNRNNIVDKTENNFINNTHIKYIYAQNISIDNKKINIKQVDKFSDDPENIEIKFTTVQKLYNDIHIIKENNITLDELNRKNIIMIADEAHHLNTDTKKQTELDLIEIKNNTSIEKIERNGWEHTIIDLILNKNNKKDITSKNNKNILLEFTATIPTNINVIEKYKDKVIYKYNLKKFIQSGYTKQINLLSSTFEKNKIILHSLLFQWYRVQIALKNNIFNFKPVILFKSKNIESSEDDYNYFIDLIKKLESSDLKFIKQNIETFLPKAESLYEQGKTKTEQLFAYIKNNNNSFDEIAQWIKDNYKKENIIITNSKKTNIEDDLLLNNLEDNNNFIRAIFTVDRLTEGWDVLNLFDIVRLYKEQATGGKTKKTPDITIKEKQLIGRGIRYFPFIYNDEIKNKRKFDNDINNELRILEELFYYTYDENSRYISYFKEELRKDGYIQDNKESRTFEIKTDLKNTVIKNFKNIWINKQEYDALQPIKDFDKIQKYWHYSIENKLKEEYAFDDNKEDNIKTIPNTKNNNFNIEVKYIEKHIFLTAINIKAQADNSLFRFNNLNKYLLELKNKYNINSIDDLQKKLLSNFKLNITSNNPNQKEYFNLSNKEKLNIVIKFLTDLENELKKITTPKKGSKFELCNSEEIFNKTKTKIIETNTKAYKDSQDYFNKALSKQEPKWYILNDFVGTNEELSLIKFIENKIKKLKEKYELFYLLRNEEVYKIYDLETGEGFFPDFLLFLKNKENNNLCYQVLIEAKGNEFKDASKINFKDGKEGWKEKFLEELKNINENNNYTVIDTSYTNGRYIKITLLGLPFYNKDRENIEYTFEKDFNEKLLKDVL